MAMKRGRSISRTKSSKKRARVSAPTRTLSLRSHMFKRSDVKQSIYNPIGGVGFYANNNTAALSASGYYSLATLPSYTEFTDLFDQYRIVWVKWKIFWNHPTDMMNFAGAQTTGVPILYTMKDTNDGSVPVSVAAMSQNETFQSYLMTRPITVSFRPKCAQAVYSGAFTSYAEQGMPWVDSNSPSVQYYGIKWAVDPNGANLNATAGTITIVSDVWVECRDVK